MNRSTKSIFLSILLFQFALGPFVSASSVGALFGPPPLPPAPDMSPDGYRIVPAPRPTIVPSNISPGGKSLPNGQGLIVGKVVDESTGAAVGNALVSIPELKLSTRSDNDGTFTFDPILVGAAADSGLFATLVAMAPGFGTHSMTDVNIIPKATATVTLALTKGSKPTSWYGIIRHRASRTAAQMQESKNREQKSATPFFSVSPLIFTSTTTPPAYIRVAMYNLNTDGSKTGALLRIDTVDFDFYIKHVLASEWTNAPNTWSATTTEQLKAGAMAVKEYGWHFVIAGSSFNYDVENSTTDQVYNSYLSYNVTDAAVDFTSHTGWYQSGLIFKSLYQSGSSTAPLTPCSSSPTNCMTQFGSKYWADNGKSYDWILNHYYTTATPTYFYIPSVWPNNTYQATGTINTVTLDYSSPSSTFYDIAQYIGGVWTNLGVTQSTVTTIKLYFH